MALPKLDTPIYELTLPLSGKDVKYRPFLVKEEKILLMALESDEKQDMTNAVKQIINNCILTEDVDIDDLPLFEIEYFFLQLRAKSVSDKVTLRYKNNKCTANEGKPCGKDLQVMINLEDIKIETNKNQSMKVELTDKIGVIMKYPKMSDITDLDADNSDAVFDVIIDCIDTIYDDKETYEVSKFSKEELNDFVSSMTQEQFNKIKEFFDNMPALKHTIHVKCKDCGFDEEVTLRGLQDFFG